MRNTLKAVWLWVNVLLLLLWIIFEFEVCLGFWKMYFTCLKQNACILHPLAVRASVCASNSECQEFLWSGCSISWQQMQKKIIKKNSEIKGNITRLIQLQIRGRSSKVLWGFEVNAILPLCFIYFQLHCPNWPQRWGEKWMGWRRRPRASYPSQTWN